MPDVDEIVHDLEEFARRPPVAPRPVDEIARRAAGVRRRRRVARAAGALALAVIAVAAVGFSRNRLERVDVGPAAPSTTTTTSDAPPTAVAAFGMTVTPDHGLRDGDTVRVDLHGVTAGGQLAVAQCAVEAVNATDPVQSCDVTATTYDNGGASDGIRFTVHRVIQLSDGVVDCAAGPRRCVVGVRGAGKDRFAPISFRTDLPRLPVPALHVSDTSVNAGEPTTVRGEGFPPGEVVVALCGPAPTAPSAPPDCDQARAKIVTADADGAFTTTFVVANERLTYDGWQRCPCVLRATAPRTDGASAAIDVRGSTARPSVRIVETGPFAPGRRVTLELTGFQAEVRDVAIGRCPDDVSGCAFPNEGFVTTDANGSARVDGYPLDCPVDACVLAWHPYEGSPAAFTTPYRMSR
jgi:hypothetical protein